MTNHSDKEARRHNSTYKKLAVQCSADPEVSGWLIKHWFSASIPIDIGIVKIATFAKPQLLCDTLIVL